MPTKGDYSGKWVWVGICQKAGLSTARDGMGCMVLWYWDGMCGTGMGCVVLLSAIYSIILQYTVLYCCVYTEL